MDQRDLLIKNGKILCMDGDVRADWLLTQGGKIARLGVGKCDPEYISGTVQIIDAGGRTVLPGFIDNHFQVVRIGLECGDVDLSHVRNYDIDLLAVSRLAVGVQKMLECAHYQFVVQLFSFFLLVIHNCSFF